MALAVISRAAQRGDLPKGGTIVEYTGGSTGTSLAFVGGALGYRVRIVTSDAFSKEKRDHMTALGAELILVPSDDGKTSKRLILAMIEKARELGNEPGAYLVDQLNNSDTIPGYEGLAAEILEQTEGALGAFVHSVGTSASSRGVAQILRVRCPGARVIAVEPAESPVLAGGEASPHKIEGVGVGFMPPLWKGELYDGNEAVSTADAKAMARRLAREESIFAGTSTGANVVAALRVAERLGASAKVVTIGCDSGLKYLSTDLFSAP